MKAIESGVNRDSQKVADATFPYSDREMMDEINTAELLDGW
ncbi:MULTISPECIES: hypothetical protein [Bacillus]|nr:MULTISPECIES: hypothetical protein [Bacillus amyloliquefaciens group]AHC44386.1 hypothetical protein U722_06235 [Bacillus amyloliquefaciens LFB112]MEC2018558.1 hypothetical protein [Bacillus velezensis]MED3436577.1 hypothetical protein [Bacillus velezensis]QBG55613.1 hypothetical protein D2M30_1283 [Bacillus amyloliquefaciens]